MDVLAKVAELAGRVRLLAPSSGVVSARAVLATRVVPIHFSAAEPRAGAGDRGVPATSVAPSRDRGPVPRR